MRLRHLLRRNRHVFAFLKPSSQAADIAALTSLPLQEPFDPKNHNHECVRRGQGGSDSRYRQDSRDSIKPEDAALD
jgi:hypothetical protein